MSEQELSERIRLAVSAKDPSESWPNVAAREAMAYFEELSRSSCLPDPTESVTSELLEAGDPELDRLVSVALRMFLANNRCYSQEGAVNDAAHLIDACRAHLDSYRAHLTPAEQQRQSDEREFEAAYDADEREASRRKFHRSQLEKRFLQGWHNMPVQIGWPKLAARVAVDYFADAAATEDQAKPDDDVGGES